MQVRVPVVRSVAEMREPERAAVQAGCARATAPAQWTASVALPVMPLGLAEIHPVMSPSELRIVWAIFGGACLIASRSSSARATRNATLPWAPAAGRVGADANARS